MTGVRTNLFDGAVLTAALIAVAACSGGPVTKISIKDQMKQVVEPASNTVFGVGGEVDPANGPDAAKVTDARWKEGADAAAKLREVATTLTEKGRGKDEAEWKKWATQLGDLADQASKAAAAKDGMAFSTVANNLGDNCTGCHKTYKPQTG